MAEKLGIGFGFGLEKLDVGRAQHFRPVDNLDPIFLQQIVTAGRAMA